MHGLQTNFTQTFKYKVENCSPEKEILLKVKKANRLVKPQAAKLRYEQLAKNLKQQITKNKAQIKIDRQNTKDARTKTQLRCSMEFAAGKFQKAYQAFKVNVNEDNLEHWINAAKEKMKISLEEITDYGTKLVFDGKIADAAAKLIQKAVKRFLTRRKLERLIFLFKATQHKRDEQGSKIIERFWRRYQNKIYIHKSKYRAFWGDQLMHIRRNLAAHSIMNHWQKVRHRFFRRKRRQAQKTLRENKRKAEFIYGFDLKKQQLFQKETASPDHDDWVALSQYDVEALERGDQSPLLKHIELQMTLKSSSPNHNIVPEPENQFLTPPETKRSYLELIPPMDFNKPMADKLLNPDSLSRLNQTTEERGVFSPHLGSHEPTQAFLDLKEGQSSRLSLNSMSNSCDTQNTAEQIEIPPITDEIDPTAMMHALNVPKMVNVPFVSIFQEIKIKETVGKLNLPTLNMRPSCIHDATDNSTSRGREAMWHRVRAASSQSPRPSSRPTTTQPRRRRSSLLYHESHEDEDRLFKQDEGWTPTNFMKCTQSSARRTDPYYSTPMPPDYPMTVSSVRNVGPRVYRFTQSRQSKTRKKSSITKPDTPRWINTFKPYQTGKLNQSQPMSVRDNTPRNNRPQTVETAPDFNLSQGRGSALRWSLNSRRSGTTSPANNQRKTKKRT